MPKSTMPTPPMTLDEKREDAVNGIFQLAQLGCIITGQYADAGAITMHGPPIAHEVAELAKENDQIAKVTDWLLQTGPYAALVGACLPLIMQVMVNHNVVPADKMANANVVKPEVLESQIKTQMAQRAMAAMLAQKQAEDELRQMEEEFKASQNGAEPTE